MLPTPAGVPGTEQAASPTSSASPGVQRIVPPLATFIIISVSAQSPTCQEPLSVVGP